jgi:hypothetical protein
VRVTSTDISTRRHLIAISDVQALETRRPFAIHACLIGGGVALVCLVFWSELAPIDRAVFLGLPALGVAIASQIGTLKVSFAFKDEVIHAPYYRVVRLRRAVEEALMERSGATPNAAAKTQPLSPDQRA